MERYGAQFNLSQGHHPAQGLGVAGRNGIQRSFSRAVLQDRALRRDGFVCLLCPHGALRLATMAEECRADWRGVLGRCTAKNPKPRPFRSAPCVIIRLYFKHPARGEFCLFRCLHYGLWIMGYLAGNQTNTHCFPLLDPVKYRINGPLWNERIADICRANGDIFYNERGWFYTMAQINQLF